jgi:hypothetical protein
VPGDFGNTNPHSSALRFAAMIKAARDFGLDQGAVNAVALTFDPRRPDLPRVAEGLAEALLARRPLGVLDIP